METEKAYLDCYDVDGVKRWNWKLPRQGLGELSSQEFSSEAEAVDAWGKDQLFWETPASFG